MLTKTKIALAAALVFGSASVALADFDFDQNLGNRYPAYAGAVAAQGTFNNAPVAARGALRSAPVALRHGGSLRTAPVRGETFEAPAQGPVYPQSPAGIGGF